MEIGRCDEPGRDAGRGPGAARRGAHGMGRSEVSARPRALGAGDQGGAARAFGAWQRERRDPARAGDPVLPGVHEGAPGDRRIRRAGPRGLQYWDAVPEYVALMKSDVPQQYPSRVAIVAYLRQSPSAEARELEVQTQAEPAMRW